MNATGWLLLVASWGVILALFVFSLSRTLREKEEEPPASGTD
jgi:hypothetical protein